MRRILTATCLLMSLAGPAAAEPFRAGATECFRAGATGDAEREIAEGLEKLRRGLTLLLEGIPRFAAPEFTEDGDIILRRTNPPVEGHRQGPPGDDREAPPLRGKPIEI